MPPPTTAPWWQRFDLRHDEAGHLIFDGHDVADLAIRFGTPAYVYSPARVDANVARLRAALAATGRPGRLLYAMKANRFAPLLRHLRELGVGLDVCSPGEVRHALACGFTLDQLSFTAGSLSTADYAALATWPELWINADSLTAIRRLAEVSPGREIGLRLNPAAGLGYGDNPLVRYAGSARPTKFGIHQDRFLEALALAENLGLRVTGLHCHAGSGFLSPQLPALDTVLTRIGAFLDAASGIRRLNLGGGLGVPLVAGDTPLDLDAWAALVRRHLGSRDIELLIEPGDHVVKDAGILLTEVTQVESKGGITFVGVNAGFNVHPEPAFYRLPLEPVPARLRPGPDSLVTIAGNINEALDVWAADFTLPPVEERDVLVFLNAGAYGASMSSAHCLRTEMSEHLLPSLHAGPDQLDRVNRRAWDELYASTPELVWGREPMPFLTAYLGDLRASLRNPVRLLDAGAGEGRNLPVLLSLGLGEVVALDASRAALDKIPTALGARVRRHQGTLDASGLPSDHFDAALLLDVAETLPALDTALRELLRLLKPGGLLLCNFAAQDDGVAGVDMAPADGDGNLYQGRYFFRFFTRDEAVSIMTAAGFDLVSVNRHSWDEESHPGFRAAPHTHVSHVVLARRPTTAIAPA